jgi:hypothetical protein
MPEHLRDMAQGRRGPTAEELERTERGKREADQEAQRDLRARQRAARERVWRECLLRSHRYRDASVNGLRGQQDPDGKVSGWLGQGDAARQLLLAGSQSRRGKTWGAYAIGAQARELDWYVTGYSAISLMEALRPGDDARTAQTWAELHSARLLILDDLGREKTSSWFVQQLHSLIEARLSGATYADGDLVVRRSIYTTNLSYDEMVERYGDPLVARILEECTVVKIEGKSLAVPAPW